MYVCACMCVHMCLNERAKGEIAGRNLVTEGNLNTKRERKKERKRNEQKHTERHTEITIKRTKHTERHTEITIKRTKQPKSYFNYFYLWITHDLLFN